MTYNSKQFKQTLQTTGDVELAAAERFMDRQLRESQGKLMLIRREIKRRKRQVAKAT